MNVSDSLHEAGSPAPQPLTASRAGVLSGDPMDTDVRNFKVHPRIPPNKATVPSPYDESELSRLSPIVGPDASEAFYNHRDPRYPINTEKARHRMVCILHVAGHSNNEIAELTGMCSVSVSNILRQPWAHRYIVSEIHRSRTTVMTIVENNAVAAAERLATEMDNMDARPSDRISAADKLLDRFLGKPNQPLTTFDGDKALEGLSDEQLAKIIRSSEATTATASGSNES